MAAIRKKLIWGQFEGLWKTFSGGGWWYCSSYMPTRLSFASLALDTRSEFLEFPFFSGSDGPGLWSQMESEGLG